MDKPYSHTQSNEYYKILLSNHLSPIISPVHQSNLPKEVLKLPKINTHRSILKASNNPNEVYENININRSSPSAKNRNLGYNGCCSSEFPRKVKKVGFVDDTISDQTSNSKIISTKQEKELQNQEHKSIMFWDTLGPSQGCHVTPGI